jgi:hypothetical protein
MGFTHYYKNKPAFPDSQYKKTQKLIQEIETILFDKYRLQYDDAAAASFEIIKIVCKHLSSK